jgi:hypothetical protein
LQGKARNGIGRRKRLSAMGRRKWAGAGVLENFDGI